MKKLIFICGLMVSSFSFAANWVYVTSSSDAESFYIDRDFYKYDSKNGYVDVWTKSVKKKLMSDGFYTSTKSLERYSCASKKSKTLAFVKYSETGNALQSNSKPQAEYSLIFPDSIGESIWSVACATKGKGFKFTSQQINFTHAENQGRFLTPEQVNKLFPQQQNPQPQRTPIIGKWSDLTGE